MEGHAGDTTRLEIECASGQPRGNSVMAQYAWMRNCRSQYQAWPALMIFLTKETVLKDFAFIFGYFGIFLFSIIGWILNIVSLFNVGSPISQWGGMEILRIVGIFFAPVGAVLGYF